MIYTRIFMSDINANRGGVNQKYLNSTIQAMGLWKNPFRMVNGNRKFFIFSAANAFFNINCLNTHFHTPIESVLVLAPVVRRRVIRT